MLVLLTGFRKPRLVVVAVLMLYQLHMTVDRKPVGMHVEEAHEYRYHDTALMEILVFIHFLYHHHLAVGRSHNEVVGVVDIQKPLRTAEEIEHDEVKHGEYRDKAPEGYLGVEATP